MKDSTRIRTYGGLLFPTADQPISDLPLDETALQTAHKTFHAMLAAQQGDCWDDLVDASISTYLREAAFEMEKDNGIECGYPRDHQRLCGPWEPIPVVQAEVELSIAREALETARDDLYKAANQFKGMNLDGKNAEIFESKAARIETVLARLRDKT